MSNEQLQRDFDLLAPIAAREQYTWEAFFRIRARLTPDRERVARAICRGANPHDTLGVGWHAWTDVADAAIAAMEGNDDHA